MLGMVAFNLNRGSDYVHLFETGDIYEGTSAGTAERARICFASTTLALAHEIPQGGVLDKSKNDSGVDLFRSFKGDVEAVLNAFEYSTIEFDEKTSDYYDPRRSARVLVNGAPIAQFGVLHPEIAARRKLRQDIYIAEVSAEELYKHPLRKIRYEPLPKYPAVERDFSFLFSDDVAFEKIDSAVRSLAISQLRTFEPVEIFRGGSVPAGSYSLLLRAKFQSHERTLREEEVNDWSAKIIAALTQLGGTQRA
jgi:phenylalanyl-tRNA synthetase beta chain